MPEVIYFDNNATTRPDPSVVEAMLPYLGEQYGNPSSVSALGSQAARAVGLAREQVAALIHCEPAEIVFTSGGTESNHAAFFSARHLNPARRHCVTTAVEHSAVLKPLEALETRGYEVTRLGVDAQGRLDLEALERAIRPDTALLSIMAANNETGVLFPVEKIGEIARAKGVLFHTDAVQAVGKIPLHLENANLHYLSASAHKIHGPKGVGFLYVNRRSGFAPMLLGGGQENGRRAGTENVPGIVGLGKAAELAAHALEDEAREVRRLRDAFESGVLAQIGGVQLNGDPIDRLPNTSNLAFEGVEAQAALILLERANLSASAGSACLTGSLAPSHVLRAMGFSDDRARSSLRFSFSRLNTAQEVEKAVEIVAKTIRKLRES
jgi:cysteine desulfurase